MELREKIQRLLFEADGTCDWAPVAGERCGQLADAILALPEIAEALRELELRKRVEKRLAGTMDERPFIDGNPLGKPNV